MHSKTLRPKPFFGIPVAMGFFDLNIPYLESSPSTDKTTFTAARTKLVIKAMELGYTGIAYNNTIKGVMSDHDRCAVSLLTLSSLLKLVPSLASSVNLHRDLLGVQRASPFRQYTRLTVCVESLPQAQALNSGNPILKTYNLVAVKPLNQAVFDQACEKSEVDIIAIDFSEKLPFRLKLPMIKAAIERGVYFEIAYSSLIEDVQTRRQMISNAKLLVDWTRGKNLIFSSAATSVNELRGPYDVANLSSLLGLSMERAKAAISKSCRTLVANALRKKQFYKEAIRVEVLSSDGKLDCNKPLSGDWFKWDPISSGEGDLLLEDMAKSFPASNKVSTVKAIDFASIINGMTSHGFQVKALTSQTEGVPQPPDNVKNFLPAAGVVEVAAAASGQTEQLDRLDLLTEPDPTSLYDSPLTHQISVCEDSQFFFSPNDTSTALNNSEEIRITTTTSKEEKENLNGSDVNVSSNVAEKNDFHLQKSFSSCESHIVPSNGNVIFHASGGELKLAARCDTGAKVELLTMFEDIILPASKNEVSQSTKHSDGVLDFVMDGERMDVDIINKERTPLDTNDGSLSGSLPETEQFREPMNDDVGAPTDCLPISDSYPEMTIIGDSSIAKHESTELTMEKQRDGESDTEANQTLVQSISGRSRPRSRTSRGAMLFPFNRLLMTTAFKRKPRR